MRLGPRPVARSHKEKNSLPRELEELTGDLERAAEATRLAIAAWAEARREDAGSKSCRQTEQGGGEDNGEPGAAAQQRTAGRPSRG